MGCRTTIGELCVRICSGGTPKRNTIEFYEDGDIPWLNTSEISFNRIRKTGQHITKAGLSGSSAKWIRKNSIAVAMYGATAGKVAITKIPLTTNQACCNLEINEEIADYRYIFYWFKNQYTRVLGLANGGAQQNLSAKTIRALEIELPALSQQRRVASFLSTIDDKIELNTQLNGYLAEIADALFTDAFGNLEDNAVLSDIAKITMGQSPAGTSYNEEGVGTVFYQGRGEFGWRYPTQRLFTTEPKRMAKSGDVLMSVRAPVGDLNLAYEDCCIGRGLVAISCDYPSYCLYLMRSLGKKLDAYNGEGTVFGSISGNALKGIGIGLPGNDDIAAFEAMVAPIDDQIRCNETECRFLSQLRDALLPKLMSGEIDVSKVDLKQLNSHLAAC